MLLELGQQFLLGSPPRTRGLLGKVGSSMTKGRITPAHAGTTTIVDIWLGLYKDHPRSRGDYRFQRSQSERLLGSPPLTRGLRRRGRREDGDIGITPAHAGTTLAEITCSSTKRDHPRSRGDYCRHLDLSCQTPGSPPLTRGLHLLGSLPKPDLRITPAHAGTTHTPEGVKDVNEDHPRSRGDYGTL